MKNSVKIEETTSLQDLDASSAAEVLTWAMESYSPRIVLVTSFGPEGIVILDHILAMGKDIRVVTIDTGRLHSETYDLIEEIRTHFGIEIEVFLPDHLEVEELQRKKGLFSFRQSLELRQECCRLRKVFPLHRALHGADAWIAGLRRQQSESRENLLKVEPDVARPHLMKINPLADWTEEQVWEYLKSRKLPYNALHDKGFPSIGCFPCTRAIQPGEHPRAGRWWWEDNGKKECGLHLKP